MALTSIGDMAQHFLSLRQGVAIRQRLATLTGEMATGTVADPVAHLGGRSDRLADIERRIALGKAGAEATAALGQRLETAQVALGQIEALRTQHSADLIATPVSAVPVTIAGGAARAEGAFAAAISALNARHGGEYLFSGAASDTPSLAAAADILSALRTATAGATDPADLSARVRSFFSDPGGGFETMGYLGDAGPAATRQIDGESRITLGPRADDPAIREVLGAFALAAVAADAALGFSDTDRADLLRQAGTDLVASAEPLTGARAALGAAQEDVETATARQSAALSAARIMRNDLVSADPAETATLLKQVQTQLETHYTLTARLSGLTLAGYLR